MVLGLTVIGVVSSVDFRSMNDCFGHVALGRTKTIRTAAVETLFEPGESRQNTGHSKVRKSRALTGNFRPGAVSRTNIR